MIFPIEVIEQDARLVFEDVLEDFSSLRGVLKRFETWRTTESGAYRDAYVSLCLPKVVAPLIRLKLLLWNPLQVNINILFYLYIYKIRYLYIIF